MKKVGSIKEFRKEFNISQSELSKKTGVSQSLISNWESGNWSFSLKNFIKIRKFINLNGYDIDFI